jgi:hypothetical protein
MREGRNGTSRTGVGAPTARGEKKSFGLRMRRTYAALGPSRKAAAVRVRRAA